MTNRRGFIKSAFGLSSALFLGACAALKPGPGTNILSLIEAIVAAAEAVLPAFIGVTGLSPIIVMTVTNYINTAMMIVVTLTSAPITAASIQTAIAQFVSNAVPQLPIGSALQGLVANLSTAIGKFLQAMQNNPPVVAPTASARIVTQGQTQPLVSTQQESLRTRAMGVMTKLAK